MQIESLPLSASSIGVQAEKPVSRLPPPGFEATDTLSDSECCASPCGFIQTLWDQITSVFTSFRDWVLSFFVETIPPLSPPVETPISQTSLPQAATEPSLPLETAPTSTLISTQTLEPDYCLQIRALAQSMPQLKRQPFAMPVRNSYDTLCDFHNLLCQITPDLSTSDLEALKANTASAYEQLPEEVKKVLLIEFYAGESNLKSSEGFPRVGSNFQECLEQDCIKTLFIVRDVLRAQQSYYSSQFLCCTSPQEALFCFKEMLQCCKFGSSVTLVPLSKETYVRNILDSFSQSLPMSCQQDLNAKLNFEVALITLAENDQPFDDLFSKTITYLNKRIKSL